jgi:glycosyltransferase involved in cell wall biosynthesis
VAAFRLGALPGLIQQNINGWIAPKGNLNILGELIHHWSTLNQEQIQQLSKNCHETVFSHYSYQAVIPKVLKVYQQAMDKKGLLWPSHAYQATPDMPARAVEPRD